MTQAKDRKPFPQGSLAKLTPAYLWREPTSLTMLYGHLAIPISGQPWDVIEQDILADPDGGERIALVTDPTVERLQVVYDPDIIVPWVEPLPSCTCPDGKLWHSINKKSGWSPGPVRPFAFHRSFKIDPSCPWCSYPDGVFHQRYLAYTWPWRRTADVALTIIYSPPPAIKINYADYANEIDQVRANLSSLVNQTLEVALKGNRDAVDGDLARLALQEVATQLIGARLQRIELEIARSAIPPTLTWETAGLSAITAILECSAWFKDYLTSTSCMRVPYIPHRTNQRGWKTRGHFAIHEYFYESWREFLEPLDIVFTA